MGLSSGVYSLIGVAVGGGMTFGGQAYIERQRDSRSKAKDDADRDAVLMAACRQVFYEINRFASAAHVVERYTDMRLDEVVLIPLQATVEWDRYRAVIASEPAIDFTLVSLAYDAARFAVVELKAKGEVSAPRVQEFREAMAELRPYLKTPPSVEEDEPRSPAW